MCAGFVNYVVMKHGYPTYNIKLFFCLLLAVCGAMAQFRISAFTLDTYAASSVLSSGKWVKIKVSSSGIHLIPNSDLQRWGFSDPSKVRVYGYGGAPISDELRKDNYVDDLPPVCSEVTSRGVVFYAVASISTVIRSGRLDYERNYYSDEGYYFLTESDAPVDFPATGTPGVSSDFVAGSFTEMLYHEQELVSPGSTGHTFLGEDFYSTPNRTFNFNLVDKVDDDVSFTCYFATKTIGATSRLNFSVNGADIPQASDNTLDASSDDSYRHYIMKELRRNVYVSGNDFQLSLSYTPSGSNVRLARLDRIVVNYRRNLRLADGKLDFYLEDPAAVLSGVSSETDCGMSLRLTR